MYDHTKQRAVALKKSPSRYAVWTRNLSEYMYPRSLRSRRSLAHIPHRNRTRGVRTRIPMTQIRALVRQKKTRAREREDS
ncbi:hypothetical protein HOLleu_06663 [Holothuria leucospilota]|uniref:Uncharacterized protein n=1 Tax=Holothuria leucospilota TaxID=206669 RepID=A0A9Q1CLQ4_HOLLE|nr:hypothetical protein HOLleu_06663 [Holothuria leucospilota]